MEKYVKEAEKLGALDAKTISADSIITATWVRLKCQFGCATYGKRLNCPPRSPTPAQTAKLLSEYESALLVHCDNLTGTARIVAQVERQVFLDGYHKAFSMGAGPCTLCGECNIADEQCLHPKEARPSMEACGIDVFQTARNNGFPIEVVTDRSATPNCYGVVLIE